MEEKVELRTIPVPLNILIIFHQESIGRTRMVPFARWIRTNPLSRLESALAQVPTVWCHRWWVRMFFMKCLRRRGFMRTSMMWRRDAGRRIIMNVYWCWLRTEAWVIFSFILWDCGIRWNWTKWSRNLSMKKMSIHRQILEITHTRIF